MVIELNHVKRMMNALEADALTPPEIKAGFTGPEALKTPFGQFYDAYKMLAQSGRKISMTEYIELRELLNRTTNQLYKNDKAVSVKEKCPSKSLYGEPMFRPLSFGMSEMAVQIFHQER